jgi:hypothetical protein
MAVGAALLAACAQTLDAGDDLPVGLLPVGETNPVILYEDDWSGDWLGSPSPFSAPRPTPQGPSIRRRARR